MRDLKVGDHVVLTYGACGHCNPCRGGHGAYCKDFFALNFGGDDGHGHTAITDAQGQPLHDHFFAQSSFATFAIAREINAIKVPDDAPLELLGPLGCGIQTGAGAVLNSLQVRSGSSFASYGAGAVGLSAVMAAKVAGATTIIAIDVVPSRLELALELGATHVVNSRETDVIEAVRAITGGGADFALESTGRPEVLSAGIEALGGLGMMGVVGAPKLGTTASFDVNNLLLGGRSIRGIVEGDSVPQVFIPQLVTLFLQGRFPFDKLVKFYPLEQINRRRRTVRRKSSRSCASRPEQRVAGLCPAPAEAMTNARATAEAGFLRLAEWVRLRGRCKYVHKLGRAIHGAHAPQPDPPRLRQFPAAVGGCRPLVGTGSDPFSKGKRL